ncbi:MAG: HAD family phosphatase [Ruminococcaceae bacterium]|nr:HAD family phosphatase [Oscillospiraceae bacterium]
MKFDNILICSDLDGTLLRNDKTISQRNLDAIEYFKSEGGLFTFVTGRMPYYVKNIYDIVKPNAPIGCVNGGGIYDYVSGRYLWIKELDKRAYELVKCADQAVDDIGIQICTFDHTYFYKNNRAMEIFRVLTSLPNLEKHYNDISEPVGKVLFGDESEEKLDHVRELLLAHPLASEFDYIRSERMLFEILPKGINKGSLIIKLADLLGIDQKRTIGIGDYDNDIELVRAAGLGVAVANAKDEVKAVADYITVSNEEDAIAALIDDIDSGKVII